MAGSCCICGVVLAAQDSDSPLWCKDIRGSELLYSNRREGVNCLYIVCQFKYQHVLSDQGSIDDDAIPLNLPIPGHGFERFRRRRTDNPREMDTVGDFCSHSTRLAGRCFKAIPTARLLITISKLYSMSSKVFITTKLRVL